jgi:hypothetical protein
MEINIFELANETLESEGGDSGSKIEIFAYEITCTSKATFRLLQIGPSSADQTRDSAGPEHM